MRTMRQSSSSFLVFVDIERRRNQITEVSAVAVDSELTELASFDALVRRRWIHPERERPHVVARRFAEFLWPYACVKLTSSQGEISLARLVAFNAERHDCPLLHQWYDAIGIRLPAARMSICIKQRALCFFAEHPHLSQPENFQLPTLCRHFGILLREDQAHQACYDVRAMLKLYRIMAHFSFGQQEAA